MQGFILKYLLMLIVVLFVPLHAHNTLVKITNDQSSYTDFKMNYMVEAPGESVGIAEISKLPFLKQTSNAFSFGYKKNNFWFHVNILNDSDESKDMVLELTEIIHKTVDLYVVSGSDTVIHKRNGLSVQVNDREIKESTPSFKLHFSPYEKKEVYIHLASIYGVFGAVEIKTEQKYFEDIQVKKYIYLFYFSAVAIIALYNLLLFFYLRENIYLLYIGHTLVFLVWVTNYRGLLLPHINMEIYDFLQITIPIFFALLIFFSQAILETKKLFPKLHKILYVFIAICAIAFIWMLISMKSGFEFVNIIAAPLLPYLLFVAFWALYKHHNTAKIYLFALLIYMVGMTLLSLMALGLLPYSIYLANAATIGSFFEILFFSLLLAYRINIVRQESLQTQKELIQLQKTESSRLFHSVAEKTKALNQANKQLEAQLRQKEKLEKHLQQLASTDPLSGLLNRRAFFDSCDTKMIDASSNDTKLSCLIIDIDHFKRINDTYGHDMGDKVIQHIAKLMTDNIRAVDTIGRIGGEEFAILMPDIEKDIAFQIADRLRENISKERILLNDILVQLTVSIGLSYLNEEDLNIHTLLKRADLALYEAKEGGRNQVSYV